MTDTTEEFQNDKIKLKVTYSSNCVVKLDVHMAPTELEAVFSKAVKTIKKEASIPGFRKGHAPDKIVAQKYGKYIEEEWQRLVSLTALRQACELAEVEIFQGSRTPEAKFQQLDREQGAQLTFQFEREPVITLPDPEKFKLEPKEPRVFSEEAEDAELRSIQFHQATWKELLDRPVAEGDYVDLDIETLGPPPVVLCQDSRFEISPDTTPSWLRQLIIGLMPGQHAEGISEKDDSARKSEETNADFQPTPCKVSVKGIFSAELPPVDDELAQKAGAQDLSDLRRKIRHRLQNQANEEAQAHLLSQLTEQLLKLYPIDAPASVIRYETAIKEANMLKATEQSSDSTSTRFEKRLEAKRMAAFAGEEWAKLSLFAIHYGNSYDLSVSHLDLVEEWIAQANGLRPPLKLTTTPDMTHKELQQRIFATVLTNKALLHLLERVQKNSTALAEVDENA